jgi:hypothetical protein
MMLFAGTNASSGMATKKSRFIIKNIDEYCPLVLEKYRIRSILTAPALCCA